MFHLEAVMRTTTCHLTDSTNSTICYDDGVPVATTSEVSTDFSSIKQFNHETGMSRGFEILAMAISGEGG